MDSAERAFFSRVKQAITTNPFSSERAKIDRELAGVSPTSPKEELFSKLNDRVGVTIDRVEARRQTHRPGLSGDDLQLLRYAKLFLVFNQFIESYDQHIMHQIDRGDEPASVEFAESALTRLHDYGFPSAEALRFFALFFQMRRAFFFIQAIAGESTCVHELRKSLWNNIFTDDIELYDTYLWDRMEDFSTMLLGETGTGKGMAASAIGRSGFIPFNKKRGCFTESFAKSFVTINLSQYPETLIESELFGHRKGAFTGAIEPHKGVFSRCSPFGAIFIDEIGDVSIPVQIKLLKVLEERRFSPVGSHSTERFQGRVIAATNQPITVMRKEGRFREDFYYRLCSDVIEVPPLRKRMDENPDEIRVILDFTIRRILGRISTELVDSISSFILENQPADYLWPGNIRELEQCTRQILLRRSCTWQPTHKEQQGLDSLAERYSLTAHQLLSHYCSQLYQKHKTYEGVAKITDLDRRTVRKYIIQLNKERKDGQ